MCSRVSCSRNSLEIMLANVITYNPHGHRQNPFVFGESLSIVPEVIPVLRFEGVDGAPLPIAIARLPDELHYYHDHLHMRYFWNWFLQSSPTRLSV